MKILMAPRSYQEALTGIHNSILDNIKTLLETRDGYVYQPNTPLIKLHSLFGTPIIHEMGIVNGVPMCKTAMWGITSHSVICKNTEWTRIPEQDLLNVYTELYSLLYEDDSIR